MALPSVRTPTGRAEYNNNASLRPQFGDYAQGAASGAGLGASVAGGWGALVGALGGLLTKGLEFRLNQDAISKQNEYNTPANQMARYRAAGLNPNLIYGNGQSSAGNQQSAAEYRAPDISSDVTQGLGVALGLVNSMAETRRNMADAKTAEANAAIAGIRADTFSELNDYQIQYALTRLLNMDQQRMESAVRIALNNIRSKYEAKTLEDRVNLTHNQAVMSQFEADKQGTDWWIDTISRGISSIVGSLFGVGSFVKNLRKTPIVVPRGGDLYFP